MHHKLWLVRQFQTPSISQEEMGDRIGVSRSTVAVYETQVDRDVPMEYVKRVADKFGWPVTWFYDGRAGLPPHLTGVGGGIGEAPPAPSNKAHQRAEPAVGRRKFPLLGSVGAASFPLESADRWPGDFVEFSDELFRPERFAITVHGDSMIPRLEHGDYVLVQPDPNPPSGLLVVAKSSEHEHTVKVLRRNNDKAELEPINKEYPMIVPGKGWEIVGFVVGRKKEGRGRYVEEGDNAGLRP